MDSHIGFGSLVAFSRIWNGCHICEQCSPCARDVVDSRQTRYHIQPRLLSSGSLGGVNEGRLYIVSTRVCFDKSATWSRRPVRIPLLHVYHEKSIIGRCVRLFKLSMLLRGALFLGVYGIHLAADCYHTRNKHVLIQLWRRDVPGVLPLMPHIHASSILRRFDGWKDCAC
jgi:hypothetical protein